MGIKEFFSSFFTISSNMEKKIFSPLYARKCPNCNFWAHRFDDELTHYESPSHSRLYESPCFFFWLPRSVGDRIGRTGSPEERKKKLKAYGELWRNGKINDTGYFDDYSAAVCPLCDTPYSQWKKVEVTCKLCGRNVRFMDEERLVLYCFACKTINYTKDVSFQEAD